MTRRTWLAAGSQDTITRARAQTDKLRQGLSPRDTDTGMGRRAGSGGGAGGEGTGDGGSCRSWVIATITWTSPFLENVLAITTR